MPKNKNSRLKDPELYESLRDDGASAEKAARISNAAARDGRSEVGHRGGEAGSYDNWTVVDLEKRARELGLQGYSALRKAELIKLLRSH
ncbi:Rho termination factor N-terminal domain-containing protein [Salinibacterium sp. NYA9b]